MQTLRVYDLNRWERALWKVTHATFGFERAFKWLCKRQKESDLRKGFLIDGETGARSLVFDPSQADQFRTFVRG